MRNKLSDIEFTVLKQTRMSHNTEIADVAKVLHGEKTAFLKAKVSHDFEVHFKQVRSY
jgi:hypothetical protein